MRPLRQTSGRPPEEIKKGDLKRITLESILEKEDSRLEKIEDKTARLILKNKERVARDEQKEGQTISPPTEDQSRTTSVRIVDRPSTHRGQSKRTVSFLTLQCIPKRMISRQILDFIRSRSFEQDNEWYVSIDTKALVEELKSNTETIKKTISRLKGDGWFEVGEWSTSGYRTLRIDPKIFGLS